MSHEKEYVEIFTQALLNIAQQADTPKELIHLWVNIGRKMGVDCIVPHLKVILYEHEEDNAPIKSVVGIIASPSFDVVEHLSSEEVFTEMLCNSSVIALKKVKDGFH
tara:strand:+ start:798 stop:1118 length:321 start_codon:yes stop_codon:yes gene_type:complete